MQVEVGNIILATGYDLFDCRRVPQYGYGRLANVFTSMEFERRRNVAGADQWRCGAAGRGHPPQVRGHCALRGQPGQPV